MCRIQDSNPVRDIKLDTTISYIISESAIQSGYLDINKNLGSSC